MSDNKKKRSLPNIGGPDSKKLKTILNYIKNDDKVKLI